MNIQEFEAFLDQDLNKAYDSLLRKIEIQLSEHRVTVEFSAMSTGSADWINVELVLENIVEYNITQKSFLDLEVLSGGIAYEIIEGIHYLDFDVYSGSGEGILKYQSSSLFFACKDFHYRIKDYNEKP